MNEILERFTVLPELDEAWRHRSGGARHRAVLAAAPHLRARILESGKPRAVRSFEIATFPYPTEYAFAGACRIPVPYIWMTNRAVLVETVDARGQRLRVLANPTDPEGSRHAPYFQEITSMLPKAFERFLARAQKPLVEQLKEADIDPASIDYITFDHLHVQAVGPMLGPRGMYPSAKLLATNTELDIARGLHPLQRYWYVEGMLGAVPEDRLLGFDHDLLLGAGVALVRTPGHTDGNHSFVFATDDGLVTVSENGVALDCYQPKRSDIPGLRAFAEKTGLEAIMNANTRERSLDQYTSMLLEAALAAPKNAGDWPLHFSSSELDRFPLAPLVRPTTAVRSMRIGSFSR
ncbi:MAG: hypothetical protein U1E65_13605 [Myxococcota bacterium]